MNLSDNDFQLFGLPYQFQLDEQQLRHKFLALQQKVHPDQFAQASPQEKRLAVQYSTRVNEAYQRLKNPTERAVYWCLLRGHDVKTESSQLPTSILIQHMQWRETLEDTQMLPQLDELLAQVRSEKTQHLLSIQHSIDEENNLEKTILLTKQLLFLDKLIEEIHKKIQTQEEHS